MNIHTLFAQALTVPEVALKIALFSIMYGAIIGCTLLFIFSKKMRPHLESLFRITGNGHSSMPSSLLLQAESIIGHSAEVTQTIDSRGSIPGEILLNVTGRGATSLPAKCEYGLIPRGQQVHITSFINGVAVVELFKQFIDRQQSSGHQVMG
jgi:hypothetical protein